MKNLCDYGCDQEAIHIFKNGNKCCSISINSCPSHRKKLKSSSPHNDPIKSKKIIEKRNSTIYKKYGVRNISQLQSIKNKKSETLHQHYGVNNPSLIDGIQEIKRQTCIKKYGVDNPAKSDIIKKKMKNTLLKTTGYSHPSKNPLVKAKKIKTNMKRRGVPNPSQDPIIFEKIMKNRYKLKEYIFPSGKIVKVQGYEPQALDLLLFKENILENDIVTEKSLIPKIFWFDELKIKHRYFSDMYIKSKNLIIEVKSTYTVTQNIYEQNQKKNATIANGYNFRLIIIP